MTFPSSSCASPRRRVLTTRNFPSSTEPVDPSYNSCCITQVKCHSEAAPIACEESALGLENSRYQSVGCVGARIRCVRLQQFWIIQQRKPLFARRREVRPILP